MVQFLKVLVNGNQKNFESNCKKRSETRQLNYTDYGRSSKRTTQERTLTTELHLFAVHVARVMMKIKLK